MPVRKSKRFQQDLEILTNTSKKTTKKTAPVKRTRSKPPPVAGQDIIVRPFNGSRYDWETAREMFMTSRPSINLSQLALRMNIPYQQVRNRATKERWVALRAQHQTQVLKEKRQDFLRKMANEAITFDETAIDAAKLGVGIITSRLIEISQIVAAQQGIKAEVLQRLKDGDPVDSKELWSVVNYKEMASLAQAALMFQQIGRTALGSEITDGTLLNDENTDLEQVVSIGGELTKDDPARLAAFLEALERAGMTSLDLQGTEDADEDEDTPAVITLDGELVPPVATPQIESGEKKP